MDGQLSPLFQEIFGNADCRGFTRVVGVGLEGKSKNGQAFAGHGTEQFPHHRASNPVLLPAVELHHRFPVVRYIGEPEMPTEIDKVKDVFLEAAATETWTCLKKDYENKAQ